MIGFKIKFFIGITGLALFLGCVELKPNQLYIDTGSPQDTVFYKSSEIYVDYITSEAWSTDLDKCISINAIPEAAYKGELGLHIKWDRTAQGCPWLGIGFGWDNWTPKDLSKIKEIAAVEFYVRLKEGEREVLPWAVGLEDYTTSQAWLGFNSNAVKAPKITTEWTRIELPLSEFNWDEQNANYSSIKQIIITLEASGEVFLDEIRIVPYSGGYRNRANLATIEHKDFIVDADTTDKIWKTEPQVFGNNEVHLAVTEEALCVATRVKDSSPLENGKETHQVWDGDCFEIAFSTNDEARRNRNIFLYSDQHLGFALSDKVIVWDWRKKQYVEGLETATKKTSSGYIFETRIPFEKLELGAPEAGNVYGLELAIDHGDMQGRERQERWNDPGTPGFNFNPSLWGEYYILTAQ